MGSAAEVPQRPAFGHAPPPPTAEIVIAKAGRPLAQLVPFREPARRRPGRAKGRIVIAKDFDAPLPASIVEAFGGRTE